MRGYGHQLAFRFVFKGIRANCGCIHNDNSQSPRIFLECIVQYAILQNKETDQWKQIATSLLGRMTNVNDAFVEYTGTQPTLDILSFLQMKYIKTKNYENIPKIIIEK